MKFLYMFLGVSLGNPTNNLPWAIRIESDGHHLCDGVQLSHQYVLSTAQCVSEDSVAITAKTSIGESVVQEVIPRRKLDTQPEYNIAVLVLETPIESKNYPIPVVVGPGVLEFSNLKIVGWKNRNKPRFYRASVSSSESYPVKPSNGAVCLSLPDQYIDILGAPILLNSTSLILVGLSNGDSYTSLIFNSQMVKFMKKYQAPLPERKQPKGLSDLMSEP